jgi:uncharacterized membrane protein
MRYAVLLVGWLGAAGAMGRAAAVWSNPDHNALSGTLTGYDRIAVEFAVALTGIDPSSERYRRYEADVVEFSGKYYTHRLATFLHTVPGALLLLLAPLQFSRHLRTRYIALHRWVGRLVLVCVIPVALSGFFFSSMPYGGVPETVVTTFFGCLFLFAAGRAFVAVRRGDIDRHREWMIRMVAVAAGIVTIRVIDLVLFAGFEMTSRTAFQLSIWLGWIVTSGAAEVWIRTTRPGTSSVDGQADLDLRRAVVLGRNGG